MLLKVVDESIPAPTPDSRKHKFRDIIIREGDMFLLPPNTPHNPVRFANTVGIVLEQRRPAGALDRMRWYCDGCGEIVHEASFPLTDLGTQIKEAVQEFATKGDAERTCRNCGVVATAAPKEGVIKDPNVAGA